MSKPNPTTDVSTDAIMVGVVVGLATGLASSFGAWWLLFRALAPRMSWDDEIAHYKLYDDRVPRSQLRFGSGPRELILLEITISMQIPGLIKVGSKESFRLCRYESAQLRPDRHMRYRIRFEADTERSLRHYLPYFHDADRTRIEQGQPIDVKQFMARYPRAALIATAIGRDAYTGATGVARKEFTAESFKDGPFVSPTQHDDADLRGPDANEVESPERDAPNPRPLNPQQ